MISIGDKAPEFTTETDSGGTVALRDNAGKYVVLYFYPKDNTSGCTAEACDFRDSMSALTELGAVVIGVSPDSPSSHDKFKAKHDLNFALAADADHSIAEAYGAWGEKSMYGKKYFGIVRSTFIIAPDGTIAAEWRKVSVKGHVSDVLKKLGELRGE